METTPAATATAAIKRPPRDYSVDLLKTIAIIGVITIHSCSGWSSYALGSFDWMSNLFWGSLTRASVPIFLMCSGALLLNPQKELGLKKLYQKNLLRILAAMAVWSMAYKIFHLIVRGNFSSAHVWQAFKEVLLFNHEFHFYYLHIIILVYIFLPVTRVFVANADKKQLQYFLAVWFALGILYPTVKPFWPFTLIYGIPTQWLLNMTYASIGYGVLGYYIKNFSPPNRKPYLAALGAGFLFTFGATWYMSLAQGTSYLGFLEGMSVGVAFMAIGIFGYVTSKYKTSPLKHARTFLFISRASFCIYLVHIFFNYLFYHVGLTIHIGPAILSIPLLVILKLICCCGVYALLSRIPIVNQWLL